MEFPSALPFTHRPGRRERHLRRRHSNPLFSRPPEEVAPEALLAAQRADHEEMESFRASFAALLRKASELPVNADSEIVLALKQELERHYEQAAGLPDDQTREQQALQRLIDVIMRSVKHHAGSDPLAMQELAAEEQAREIHFRLLAQPLVADLLHPESPIQPHELTPSVLGASVAEINAVCEIFDGDQIAIITDEAMTLRRCMAEAGLNLEVIDRSLGQLRATLARLRRSGVPT